MLNLFLLIDSTVSALAEDAVANPDATQNASGIDWSGIIMIVLLIAIFYFLMIRPQQKRQKEIQKFRESLTVGSNVITAGGIYGRIDAVKDTYFVLDIGDKTKIKIDKGSVYQSPEAVAESAGK